MDADDTNSWDSIDDYNSDPEVVVAKCLYIGSKHFNPALALACTDLEPPFPDAQTYSSIEEFKRCVPNFEVEGKPPPLRYDKLKTEPTQASSSQPQPMTANDGRDKPTNTSAQVSGTIKIDENQLKSVEPIYPIPGRRFLPHQLPVYKPRKQKPNVLTLMSSSNSIITRLNEAKLKHQRIKIWTKDKFGIRGYCTGTVECFDKHWNLILKDVDEVFQRRRGDPKDPKVNPGNETTLDRDDEKIVYKSGQLLSEYTKRASKKAKIEAERSKIDNGRVRRGTQTKYLIEGPENAIEVCRIGIRALMLQGMEKEDKSEEIDSESIDESNPPVTKSTLRKKQLVILRKPGIDFVGNRIVARSQMYEIIQGYIPQLVLMGRTVAFIETNLENIAS